MPEPDEIIVSLTITRSGAGDLTVASDVNAEDLAAFLERTAEHIRAGDHLCADCQAGTPHDHPAPE